MSKLQRQLTPEGDEFIAGIWIPNFRHLVSEMSAVMAQWRPVGNVAHPIEYYVMFVQFLRTYLQRFDVIHFSSTKIFQMIQRLICNNEQNGGGDVWSRYTTGDIKVLYRNIALDSFSTVISVVYEFSKLMNNRTRFLPTFFLLTSHRRPSHTAQEEKEERSSLRACLFLVVNGDDRF